ncbi:MAG: 3-dehydroquinate synthase [Syntrophomonadaceae bacterium]|nr:3-dehydroquinate synthase [Syntrophomonadaceae bacterium]
MADLIVDLGDRSYEIFIDSNILGQAGDLVKQVTSAEKVLLVSNPLVYSIYGYMCISALQNCGFEVSLALMPDGEKYKNIDEAMKIVDQAVKSGIERSSLCIALGGGVVGDLAGFAASIYQRGIDFIQIPTTLLAQVDSSVGGKVAINHHSGKNLLGSFHQPRLVIIDTDTLRTLNNREFTSGLGEVVKYGIVYDHEFFSYLEAHAEELIELEEISLQKTIYRSCQIKSEIVAQDEKEEGLRAILNLGHTFGHAVEKLGDYKLFRHGEAVAMGITAACYLSHRIGLMTTEEMKRVEKLFMKLQLKSQFPSFAPEDVISAMQADKKIKNRKINFVLPRGIGDYVITDDITHKQIENAILAVQK